MKKAIIFWLCLALAAPVFAGTDESKLEIFGKWSGSGIKQTESFTPTKRECVIAWRVKPEDPRVPIVIFQIFVHDDNDRMVDLVANVTKENADSSVVRLQPGKKYYLKINAAGRWSVLAGAAK